MNTIVYILIGITGTGLLALFIIGSINDARKSMHDLREARDKKKKQRQEQHQHHSVA